MLEVAVSDDSHTVGTLAKDTYAPGELISDSFSLTARPHFIKVTLSFLFNEGRVVASLQSRGTA